MAGGDIIVPGSQPSPLVPPEYGPWDPRGTDTENEFLAPSDPSAYAPPVPKADNTLTGQIMSKLGYSQAEAETLAAAALSGNTQAIKSLQAAGINFGAVGTDTSGTGSTRVLFPDEVAQIRAQTDQIIAQTGTANMQTRQLGALFDPNYADGALVPLPDGTSRLNGTEIIVNSHEKGDFKPVTNAPGYFVDPITGTVIDTNGNQIAKDQLQETIRSNQANEAINQTKVNNDLFLGKGDLNLRSATSGNQQTIDAANNTNQANIGAKNAEVNAANAQTGRTASGGDLAVRQQQLQDQRVSDLIKLQANPNDFVESQYTARAIASPTGTNSPAFKDNPQVGQAIGDLLNKPVETRNLPTYTAPTLTPLPKFAEGTDNIGTTADTFIAGDPQANGQPNPEVVDINNPGPNTTASVTPMQGTNGGPQQDMMDSDGGEQTTGNDSGGGLEKLIAGILVEISNKWSQGSEQGPAQYAYGTAKPKGKKPLHKGPVDTTGVDDRRNEHGISLSHMQFGPTEDERYGTTGDNPVTNKLSQIIAAALQNMPKFAYGTGWSTSAPYTPGPSQVVTTQTNGGGAVSGGASALPVPGNIPSSNSGASTQTPVSTNPNTDTNGNYNGPVGANGDPLGNIRTYGDQAIQGLPLNQYIHNAPGNETQFNQLGTGSISSAFGTHLPDVGGVNYRQLLNIQNDPEAWGVLSSLYRSGNRNLESILARVRANAPIGNAISSQSAIRTGG